MECPEGNHGLVTVAFACPRFATFGAKLCPRQFAPAICSVPGNLHPRQFKREPFTLASGMLCRIPRAAMWDRPERPAASSVGSLGGRGRGGVEGLRVPDAALGGCFLG